MGSRSGTSTMAAFAVAFSLATPAVAAPARPPHPSEAVPQVQTCAADEVRDSKAGQGAFVAGLSLTVVGAVVGVAIGVPALLLRRNARESAAKATYEARQRRYARRADRRETVAVAAIGTGGAMMVIGIPLMILGSRAKRSDRAAVTPIVTPTMAGMNASLRF